MTTNNTEATLRARLDALEAEKLERDRVAAEEAEGRERLHALHTGESLVEVVSLGERESYVKCQGATRMGCNPGCQAKHPVTLVGQRTEYYPNVNVDADNAPAWPQQRGNRPERSMDHWELKDPAEINCKKCNGLGTILPPGARSAFESPVEERFALEDTMKRLGRWSDDMRDNAARGE